MDTNFGGFCANRSRGSISHSNLSPIFIDFEDSRDMFFLRAPVVSGGGRSGGLKRRSSEIPRGVCDIVTLAMSLHTVAQHNIAVIGDNK
jgi:hypothetical protein